MTRYLIEAGTAAFAPVAALAFAGQVQAGLSVGILALLFVHVVKVARWTGRVDARLEARETWGRSVEDRLATLELRQE